MLAAQESDLLSPAEFALVVLLGVAALGALAAVFVRPVARGQGVLVRRAGRVRRARAQGLVAVVPFVDRLERVSLDPVRLEPLVARGPTSDGLPVVVVASAAIRIVDLDRASTVSPTLYDHAADSLEQAMSTAIDRMELRELAGPDGHLLRAAVRAQFAALAASGIVLDWFDVESIEVTASAELLTWADAHASRR